MKRLALLLMLLAVPANAQNQTMDEGAEAMSRGMQLLLEGLMQELGPALETLRNRLGELDAYHPPEVLENGDILIRRKRPDEVGPPGDDEVDI